MGKTNPIKPQQSKKTTEEKQRKRIQQMNAANNRLISTQSNSMARVNGSMSRMQNPSAPQYPQVPMKVLKYFRPLSAWQPGPIGSSIVLAENIGFTLDDFVTLGMTQAWEAVRLDRLECFWELQQDIPVTPHTVFSSVDPALLDNDFGSSTFQEIISRQNLQRNLLNVLTPSVLVADFVPVPILITTNADATLVPTEMYKKQWLSAADPSKIKFSGIRIADLIVSNPYSDPSNRPGGVLSCRLHFSVRGKAVDNIAYSAGLVDSFEKQAKIAPTSLPELRRGNLRPC